MCGGIGFSVYQIKQALASYFESKEPPSTISEPQIEYEECYVLSDALNIRREPNADSEIIITVTKNTKLKVYFNDRINDWVRVIYNDKNGYANQKFLSVNNEETK